MRDDSHQVRAARSYPSTSVKLTVGNDHGSDEPPSEGGIPPSVRLQRDFDISDYLDATSDASRRTRNVTIALVVASALLLAALLNSLQNTWMLQRIHASADPFSPYVIAKIGPPPITSIKDAHTPQALAAMELYEMRYEKLYAALVESYTQNSYSVRVPFFGFTFDVNDLGLIGGLGLASILLLLSFSLRREIENLRVSFQHVAKEGHLHEFYVLLSMRQVFTVPRTDTVERTRFISIVPKLITLLPFVVHLAIVWHDIRTNGVGQAIDDVHTLVTQWFNLALLATIAVFTGSAIRQLHEMDCEWDAGCRELEKAGAIKPLTISADRDVFALGARWLQAMRSRGSSQEH